MGEIVNADITIWTSADEVKDVKMGRGEFEESSHCIADYSSQA
jgi:hypothetical protein